ncbi:MAG: pilin [Candidatus Paceibacterota bacterium]|jgi:hypothetical protein
MKKTLFSVLCAIIIFSAIVPVAVFAAPIDPSVGPPPGTIDDLTADDVVRIIINIRNWFAGIVLIIAVAAVLVSAFMFMTAGGDDKKVDIAKKILKNAVIGIVVALLAFGIVSLISSTLNDLRGGGTSVPASVIPTPIPTNGP